MATTAVDNGVNVGALLEAREALRKAPEAAKFTWRATCKWKKGTRSRTLINNFFGLGQEQKHRTEFTFEADHPEIFASEDCGATPVELVLAGLASCLTAGVAALSCGVLLLRHAVARWRRPAPVELTVRFPAA